MDPYLIKCLLYYTDKTKISPQFLNEWKHYKKIGLPPIQYVDGFKFLFEVLFVGTLMLTIPHTLRLVLLHFITLVCPKFKPKYLVHSIESENVSVVDYMPNPVFTMSSD